MTTNKPRFTVKNGEVINKASNIGMPVSRLRMTDGNFGYGNFRAIQDYVNSEMVSALKWPKSLETYDKMDYDHDVYLGRYLSQLFVEKAFVNPEVSFNVESQESKDAAEFVKWCLNNMDTSLMTAIRNAYSCKKYGFSVLVKNYESISHGKYKGKYDYKISSLSPRAQKTLDRTNPFILDAKGRVRFARQDLNTLSSSNSVFEYDFTHYENKGKSYVDIPRNKFMLFSYDSVNGNPLGVSPYRQAYRAWKEKTLVSDYEVIGSSKDLGGTPILYAPSSILERASNEPSSPEAAMLKQLQNSMAEWHSGNSSYMILPSDITDGSTTVRQFDLTLKGVDGGGKQYKTSDIIESRQKSILNCFGAAFILLGQGGGGSYALADSQSGLHSFFVEKDINFICEVFNNELIPQLLAINEIRLEEEDMPKLVQGTVDEKDVDLVSKAVQRASSVGMLPQDPNLINEVLEDLGYNYRIPQEVVDSPEKWKEWSQEYMPSPTSRSGDGMQTAGSGTSTDAMGEDDADAGNLDS